MRPAERRRRNFERGSSKRDFTFRGQVQLEEQTRDVRQITDNPAQRRREFYDERWRRHDLIRARQFGLLINVYHFQVAAAFQFRFAELPDS